MSEAINPDDFSKDELVAIIELLSSALFKITDNCSTLVLGLGRLIEAEEMDFGLAKQMLISFAYSNGGIVEDLNQKNQLFLDRSQRMDS